MAEHCLAEFESPDRLIFAVARLREDGYERLESYSPHPIEGLSQAFGFRRSRVPRYTLAGGLFGAISAYLGQWWMNAVDYPLNVGGRPAHSAPAFIPITFELTVLCGALATVLGWLIEARIGSLYKPVDQAEGFGSSMIDRFWLSIDAGDARLLRPETERVLLELGAERILWVRA